MMDDEKRGFALGAANYITKPTNRKRLAQMLKKYRANVHTVLDKAGRSREDLMQQVRDLLAGWVVPAERNGYPDLARVTDAARVDENAKGNSHV
jgi:YesN/AraC family two-component response regulator